MKTLRKGNEPNALRILVNGVDLKPFAQMQGGMIVDGIILNFGMYDLDDVLNQMLDDYGEEELIKRIKALR